MSQCDTLAEATLELIVPSADIALTTPSASMCFDEASDVLFTEDNQLLLTEDNEVILIE